MHTHILGKNKPARQASGGIGARKALKGKSGGRLQYFAIVAEGLQETYAQLASTQKCNVPERRSESESTVLIGGEEADKRMLANARDRTWAPFGTNLAG